MTDPKPIIPDQAVEKRPALPVRMITKAELLINSESFFDRAKKFIAEQVLKQIIKNADKIMTLVNKYEDYLLVYIENPTFRTLIDGATDILGKLVKEWTKSKK